MPRDRLIEIDAFKGLLMCLIVLGHNSLFSHEYPVEFSVLYNFHVACFLLLPCIFFGRSIRGLQVVDRLVRYLVPHLTFYLLACVLFFYFFVPKTMVVIQEWLGNVLIALLFSSEETYSTAVGLRLFWFLPALLSLLFLRSLFFGSALKGRIVLLCLALVVHLCLGFVSVEFLPYIPYGLPLVFFLFPLGLLVGYLWQKYQASDVFFLLGITVFVTSIYVGVKFGSYSGLAGDPRVFSVHHPFQLAFHDIYLVSAFFALIGLMRFSPPTIQKVFAFIGARSLPIFLLHTFIWQGFIHIGLAEWLSLNFSPILALIGAFLSTLVSAILISIILENIPRLYSFVFPGSVIEWRRSWSRTANH